MTHPSQFLMMSNPSRCVASSFLSAVRFFIQREKKFRKLQDRRDTYLRRKCSRETIIITSKNLQRWEIFFLLILEMAFSPYNSPIDPGFYSTLALFLMVAGLASSAVFIVKQV